MAKEEEAIRKFVVRELQKCSDLSTLTVGILRRRYLEKVGRESLSIDHRQLMKKTVEEELLKMQFQDSSDDEPLIKIVNPSKSQSKRKRADEENELGKTKRSRLEESSPDSPDSGIEKAINEREQKEDEAESDKDMGEVSEEEQEEKNIKKKMQNKRPSKQSKQQGESEKKKKLKEKGKVKESDEDEELEDSDEEEARPKKSSNEKKKDSDSEEEISDKLASSDSEDEKVKTQSKRKDIRNKKPVERDIVKEVERQVFGSSSESEEENNKSAKRKNRSNSENESSGDSEEEKDPKEDAANSSSKEMEKNEEKLQDNQEEAAEDSDSSSLPSMEDEYEQEKDKNEQKKSTTKKKRNEERENTTRGKDEENKAVSRLKRYIALCGVRRNYKKLLDGCRSVKAKVAVLKKELEELGVEGQPSIEKCKKARLKREEAQELAELDLSNIIATQGRPKRRAAAAAWPPAQSVSPPPSAYKRAVDSDSDSGESHRNTGHKRGAAWANLQGIISDDGESD
ncbi:HIRA-interacting protein 3 isoform X1 [Carassius gibelio]|uniref:HIRA-interacting protein 3 isoform X1 n=2 Tax=Carassius gibelio TaxID=101364 RepID=UPI002277ECDF|nr:HIRA-interacting protein 3 isoform X1 [Carassius gibelio]